MPYPVGTVVGRYSECYCLTQGGEGDHDGVLPQHRQLHLLIHLQMKKPVLSRTLLLLSLPSPTLPDLPTKQKKPSFLGTKGTEKSFWFLCWNVASSLSLGDKQKIVTDAFLSTLLPFPTQAWDQLQKRHRSRAGKMALVLLNCLGAFEPDQVHLSPSSPISHFR